MTRRTNPRIRSVPDEAIRRGEGVQLLWLNNIHTCTIYITSAISQTA
jgi:hypothetical protein